VTIADNQLIIFGGEDDYTDIERVSLAQETIGKVSKYEGEVVENNLAELDGDGIDDLGLVGVNGFFFEFKK